MVLNAVNDFVDTPLSTAEQMRLFKKALVVKRVVNMNGKGKQPSMYALVVVGNGKGLAGYGEGKDEEAARAVFKATNKAIKNLRYFDRYDDRTIPMDIEHKFHATRLELRSRPPGIYEKIACICDKCIHDWLYRIWLPCQPLHSRDLSMHWYPRFEWQGAWITNTNECYQGYF